MRGALKRLPAWETEHYVLVPAITVEFDVLYLSHRHSICKHLILEEDVRTCPEA